MKLEVVGHEAEEGGYWAEVPAIPGCATQAGSFEELFNNLHRAIEGCLSVDMRDIAISPGDLEVAARIAGHESTRTTQLRYRLFEETSLDEIGRHVGEHAGRDLPEQLVLLVRPLETADSRCRGGMPGREIERVARSALVPALLDELVHDRANACNLFGAEQRFDRDISVGEVVFTLDLGEDSSGMGQHCFRRHRNLPPNRARTLIHREYINRGHGGRYS